MYFKEVSPSIKIFPLSHFLFFFSLLYGLPFLHSLSPSSSLFSHFFVVKPSSSQSTFLFPTFSFYFPFQSIYTSFLSLKTLLPPTFSLIFLFSVVFISSFFLFSLFLFLLSISLLHVFPSCLYLSLSPIPSFLFSLSML